MGNVSVAAWLAALQALVPPGQALTRDPRARWTRLLEAIAAMLRLAQLRFEALLIQWDPRDATSMLPDWERLLGLPDDCLPLAGLSTVDRQRVAYQRLLDQGGQSRAYFIGLADLYGEPSTTITEFRQFNCQSRCIDALYSQADEFVWRVNFAREAANGRPMNCQSTCASALFTYDVSIAECPIRERAPAHTTVTFGYATPLIGLT